MGREEQLLATAIADTIAEARSAEKKVEYELRGISSVDQVDEPNWALETANETLRSYVQKLYRDIGVLAERMLLPQFASRISSEHDRLIADKAPLGDLDVYDGEFYSPHLARLQGHFDSIAIMTDGTAVTGLDVFRNILENTPAIMSLMAVEPQSEKDVRQAVFGVLKIAFHDAVREIPVAQVLKTFKPDLGVRSLMAAAEYKFAEDETELKSALEGIYTDMKGYGGHDEWRTFYAVIYCTSTIVHQERLVQEFDRSTQLGIGPRF